MMTTKIRHLFADPKPGETWRDFSIREEAAYRLRRDELQLAMLEGCDADVDIEQRLRDKGLITE